jgi:uncharacterized membrane protein (UPF0127 family)
VRFIVFHKKEEQIVGLQHMETIPDETIFIFPGIAPGTEFHSRNVREPFDIAFLDRTYRVLKKATLTPEKETVEAPVGTALVIEAREGLLSRHGVVA